MPQKHGPINFIDRHLAWFFAGLIVLLGVALLATAARLIARESFWHEVVRDVGIAFVIAAVVSVTYETVARSRFFRDSMEAMLTEIFGNIVQPDVWREVKDHIIRHQMIREGLDIQLELMPHADATADQMVLWMRFKYDLRGLHSKPGKKRLSLRHYLDDHVKRGIFPCFDLITIGGQPQPLGQIMTGEFECKVDLDYSGGEAVEIVTVRRELTYVPGSYYLMMTELTKGLALHLTDAPNNIQAEVNVRPHKEKVPLIENVPNDKDFKNTILLPGQGIEFRFRYKEQAPQGVAATVAVQKQ